MALNDKLCKRCSHFTVRIKRSMSSFGFCPHDFHSATNNGCHRFVVSPIASLQFSMLGNKQLSRHDALTCPTCASDRLRAAVPPCARCLIAPHAGYELYSLHFFFKLPFSFLLHPSLWPSFTCPSLTLLHFSIRPLCPTLIFTFQSCFSLWKRDGVVRRRHPQRALLPERAVLPEREVGGVAVSVSVREHGGAAWRHFAVEPLQTRTEEEKESGLGAGPGGEGGGSRSR